MIRLASKTCRKCAGTGIVPVDGGHEFNPCRKCDGTGMIRGGVRRVAHVDDPQIGDVVVELREDGVYLRRKGKRTVYGPLSFYGLFMAGARQYAELRRLEKKGRALGRGRRKLSRRGKI